MYDWWQIPPNLTPSTRRDGIRTKIANMVESRAYEYVFLTVVALNAGYIFALASLGDEVGDRSVHLLAYHMSILDLLGTVHLSISKGRTTIATASRNLHPPFFSSEQA
jgi:hypothetical protein